MYWLERQRSIRHLQNFVRIINTARSTALDYNWSAMMDEEQDGDIYSRILFLKR